MKKFIFGFAAIALSAPMALLAQEPPESPAQGEHGQMACCQRDEDGEMQCPMMDPAQMDHSQMDHGQMGHGQMEHGQGSEGIAPGSADGHPGMAHCDMMGRNADHPAARHDGHAQDQGSADHSQHQGHAPQ